MYDIHKSLKYMEFIQKTFGINRNNQDIKSNSKQHTLDDQCSICCEKMSSVSI